MARTYPTCRLANGRALGFGYMPEDRRLVPDLTVEENMLLPAWANNEIDGPKGLSFVYDLMPELTKMAARKALLLSGGQQKMVALGRALIAGRKLLLLDEPFEGVAPALGKADFGSDHIAERRRAFGADCSV